MGQVGKKDLISQLQHGEGMASCSQLASAGSPQRSPSDTKSPQALSKEGGDGRGVAECSAVKPADAASVPDVKQTLYGSCAVCASRLSAQRQLELKLAQVEGERCALQKRVSLEEERARQLETKHAREIETNQRLRLILVRVQGTLREQCQTARWHLERLQISVREDLHRLEEDAFLRPLAQLERLVLGGCAPKDL